MQVVEGERGRVDAAGAARAERGGVGHERREVAQARRLAVGRVAQDSGRPARVDETAHRVPLRQVHVVLTGDDPPDPLPAPDVGARRDASEVDVPVVVPRAPHRGGGAEDEPRVPAAAVDVPYATGDDGVHLRPVVGRGHIDAEVRVAEAAGIVEPAADRRNGAGRVDRRGPRRRRIAEAGAVDACESERMDARKSRGGSGGRRQHEGRHAERGEAGPGGRRSNGHDVHGAGPPLGRRLTSRDTRVLERRSGSAFGALSRRSQRALMTMVES